MNDTPRKDPDEERDQLASLLESAEHGRATIITRHGWPVAVVAPVDMLDAGPRQAPLTPLAGSGRGLWGDVSTETLRRLREE